MIFSAAGLELYLNRTTFGTERLTVQGDSERLSWVRGNLFGIPSGNNFLLKSEYSPERSTGEFLYFSGLICTVTVREKNGAISFNYLFKNDGKKPVELEEGEIGVYTPFNDDFDDPEISLRRRVHAHVRAQKSVYVFCERYSGDLPCLGLVFVKGESGSYSLEREARAGARGAILLNFPPMTLAVGDTYECEFLLFSCHDRADFFRKADSFGVLTAEANDLSVFEGEEIRLRSARAKVLKTEKGEIPFVDGECVFCAEGEGAHSATILSEDQAIAISYFVIPKGLPEKRAAFVTEKQYLSEGKYAGAFTAYDCASGERVIRAGVRSPFSIAGFRAAPLLFLLREAQKGDLPKEILDKIERSIAFYDREIYRGGEVSDDVGGKRTRLFKRYYNYPLYAAMKYEEYRYKGDLECLMQGAVILINLYRSGSVYEVTPALMIAEALRAEGKSALVEELTEIITGAADRLISSGNKYTPFKGLSYGPEIVYGALSTLLDAYFLTGKEYYLLTAKEHLLRLETFSFPSLDYATQDIPEIFQRDRSNGMTYDMSPHFTAAHFAVLYEKYYRATGEKKYHLLAHRIMKGTLSLFDKTGMGRRSRSAVKKINDTEIPKQEEISYGEDVVLYHFNLLFGNN